MKQISLSMKGYFDKGKKTRREQFLAELEQVVPWVRPYAVIDPHYPKGSPEGGRPPLALERMFRIYFCSSGTTFRTPAKGHDRGCHDHQRALLDEEREEETRSPDASDEKGQAVASA